MLTTALLATPALGRSASASSISSDQSSIKAIEQKIINDGLAIERIVVLYDKAQAHEQALVVKLAENSKELRQQTAALAVGRRKLHAAAVAAYVSGDGQDSAFALLSASAPVSSLMSVYEGAAAGNLDSAVTAVLVSEHRISLARTALRLEHAASVATLKEVSLEQRKAKQALAADESLLKSVKGNLAQLLAAARAKELAAERARERQLAHNPPPTVPPATVPPTTVPSGGGSPPPPPPPPPPPSSSGYTDPLSGVSGLSPERIDQGVDYSGYGPITALGSGVVSSTYNGGWPGGTFITYQLSSGPAAGLTVYAAEDIVPSVSVGQTVSAGEVIGTVYEGPDGIETGWADGGAGNTMAMSAGQFYGSNSTAFGANFSQLLASLGAPPGILQNNPPTGSLPSGWPTW